MSEIIAIDGSQGEGGGQVVRTSVALSAITGRACHLTKIRARRANPGLAAQHLAAVEAARQLAAASVEGAKPGSTELLFRPSAIASGRFHIAVGTAGAATLVLQAAIPIALHAPGPVEITVTGGTDVSWSPLAAYLETVLLVHLSRLGMDVRMSIIKHGVHPKGGGEVRVDVTPWDARPATPIELLEQGTPQRLDILSLADETLARARVAERQVDGFVAAADPAWGPIAPRLSYVRMRNPGTSILARLTTTATVLGASAIGARGKPAERVGREAASRLEAEWASGAAVDRHLADQIVPFLGLLGGRVRTSEITPHTETNMRVAERFLPVRFHVEETTVIARRRGT